ncbi:aromatic-ring-hydroxylating dioxygenase subunit beta [Streptomyces sp. NPDC000151]|uniref:aromatic-ring-hydroxylating dioxygenase subunit beta n=1 Tax=Streptomyces sp. NPDC000151 TaxID=3154244 RepID=UPI003318D761
MAHDTATTVTGNGTPVPDLPVDLGDARVRAAIALIWHEARLLDAKEYGAWDTLWAPGGTYVVPIDPDTTDFAATLNLVYDDDRLRRMRIERLTGGFSLSAAAAARTVRTVSGFTVTARDEDTIELRSAMVLVGHKREETFVLAADVTHHLVFDQRENPRIQRKIIRLVNSQDAVTASGFLL